MASELPPTFWNSKLRKVGVNIGVIWSRASYEILTLELRRGSVKDGPGEYRYRSVSSRLSSQHKLVSIFNF